MSTQSKRLEPRVSEGGDVFVQDLERHAGADGAADIELSLLQLTAALEPVMPQADARARLLADVTPESRYARFTAGVAELLDIGMDKAREILLRLDDPSLWSLEMPGVKFLWVEGGASVANAVRGFVRIEAGTEFPDHLHHGDEKVLVIQGAYRDGSTGTVYRPGDIGFMPGDSKHRFSVPADGIDLLKLVVVQNGLLVGDKLYEPR